jgi:mannose-6-phosphate isomerase-like protein (cupin superfamily)
MSASDDIRRIVTTHDAAGNAVVLFDGPTPHKVVRAGSGIVSRRIWVTDQAPSDISTKEDRAHVEIGTAPPTGGSVFRIVDSPPMGEEAATPDPAEFARQMGLAHGAADRKPPRHPFMHRTRSIDYAIVMSGEIDMMLDTSEVHLKAGDIVVQQGTNHAWINRGKETCRIAFVLIDAQEP